MSSDYPGAAYHSAPNNTVFHAHAASYGAPPPPHVYVAHPVDASHVCYHAGAAQPLMMGQPQQCAGSQQGQPTYILVQQQQPYYDNGRRRDDDLEDAVGCAACLACLCCCCWPSPGETL